MSGLKLQSYQLVSLLLQLNGKTQCRKLSGTLVYLKKSFLLNILRDLEQRTRWHGITKVLREY